MRTLSSNRVLLFVTVMLCAGIMGTSNAVWAQDIDKAIKAFRSKDYESSAAQFYSVLRFGDADQGDIAEAQYGLAKSFAELDLHLAALKYWEDILRTGNVHPYFDKAVEGLLNTAEALKDDLKAPQIIDAIYTDANKPSLEKMNPEVLQRVHFLLGRYTFNRGNFGEARSFLSTVKSGNPRYAHAQYMLGLIRLGIGRQDNAKIDYEKAASHFENARKAIPENSNDEDMADLRDLVTLGLGRLYYEQAYELDEEDPNRGPGLAAALNEFQKVPRFSPWWGQSLFERAWAFTVKKDYGRALGVLHSLKAPYFTNEFFPEADNLRAIVYYYNCQWDRVNTIIGDNKQKYEPMAKKMQDMVEKGYDLDEWYPILKKSMNQKPEDKVSVLGADDLLPLSVATALERDSRFSKMQFFLKKIEKESKLVEKNRTFNRSEMANELIQFADDAKGSYLAVVGKYLKTRIGDLAQEILDVSNRASIITLETRTAEVQWLEQGKNVENQNRKRLPRPFIPDDTFLFWWFRGEHWIDELGYYEYTLKTECFEE